MYQKKPKQTNKCPFLFEKLDTMFVHEHDDTAYKICLYHLAFLENIETQLPSPLVVCRLSQQTGAKFTLKYDH